MTIRPLTLKAPSKPEAGAILLALFAFGWLLARAIAQSVTIDEADTYLGFVYADWPAHWYPASGNHVLNSILIHLVTWLFGVSQLTLRVPALTGAAAYLVGAYGLCRLLVRTSFLFLPLFACLTINPFVMDHLVAARGYSLALGSMTLGMCVVLQSCSSDTARAIPRNLCLRCAFASLCFSASFNANFSFAYVDAVGILMLAYLVCRRRRPWGEVVRVCASCVLPGLALTLAISGSILQDWPAGQLVFGAHSLRETYSSVVASSFYELNRNLVNPLLFRLLDRSRGIIPAFSAVILCAQCVLAIRSRKVCGAFQSAPCRRTAVVSGILTLTIILHELQFHLFGVLLPKDRTALFIAPLGLCIFAGVAVCNSASSKAGSVLLVCTQVVLCFLAVYFAGSLRLLYFKEWRFDADVRPAYESVRAALKKPGLHAIGSDWKYTPSLNFYRHLYKDEDRFKPFETIPGTISDGPAKFDAYVVYSPDNPRLYTIPDVKVIYKGGNSDLVVVVKE